MYENYAINLNKKKELFTKTIAPSTIFSLQKFQKRRI